MSEPWEAAPSEPREQRGRGAYGEPRQQPDPYARQDGYGRRSSATPYLERNPYAALSETNLDREAAYPSSDRYGEDYRDRGDYRSPVAPDRDRYGDRGAGARPGPARSRRPVKESNGVAVAGAVLSFVPLLGLLLSIIGLAMAKARNGGGRTAGTVGVVLSLLFSGALGYGVYKVANSTAADPACLSAEADVLKLTSTLNTDGTALNAASQGTDKARFTTAADKFVSDVDSLEGQLTQAQAEATHTDVRTAIANLDTDLSSFTTGMHQAISGNTSNESATTQAVNRLQSDGDSLDGLCGDVGNG